MLYWHSIRPKSMADVFNAPQVSIIDMAKESGEAWIRALMVKWMNGFLHFYSVSGTMDAYQVADTINLILEIYPHYTQYDFKLFFNMAKKGMFGQVFGRMDGEVIMSWLSKYDIHRDTEAMNESINQANIQKSAIRSHGTLGWVYYEHYMELKKRAEAGDKEAIALLRIPESEQKQNH